MIIEVRREKAVNGAIPSIVYIDGVKFCYGLENESYKIPAGTYTAYGQLSPKFGTNKIYLNVDGRTGILFHGGNVADDSRGCVLVGFQRNSAETIQGDASNELFNRVNSSYLAGDSIDVKVYDSINIPWWLIPAAAVGIYLLGRNK